MTSNNGSISAITTKPSSNGVSLGFKGSSFANAGFIYAPYVPMATSKTVSNFDMPYKSKILGPWQFDKANDTPEAEDLDSFTRENRTIRFRVRGVVGVFNNRIIEPSEPGSLALFFVQVKDYRVVSDTLGTTLVNGDCDISKVRLSDFPALIDKTCDILTDGVRWWGVNRWDSETNEFVNPSNYRLIRLDTRDKFTINIVINEWAAVNSQDI